MKWHIGVGAVAPLLLLLVNIQALLYRCGIQALKPVRCSMHRRSTKKRTSVPKFDQGIVSSLGLSRQGFGFGRISNTTVTGAVGSQIPSSTDCLCGSGMTYDYCCGRIHRMIDITTSGATVSSSSNSMAGVRAGNGAKTLATTHNLLTQQKPLRHEGKLRQDNPELRWRQISPVEITRARYTAFAISIPDFLVATTHWTNKDYIRHTSNQRDPRKSYKAWCKELAQQNSAQFDFLKFEIMFDRDSNEPGAVTEELRQLMIGTDFNDHPVHIVRYRMLVREKKTSNIIPIQEDSIFVRSSFDQHFMAPIVGGVKSTRTQTRMRRRLSESEDKIPFGDDDSGDSSSGGLDFSSRWFYSVGAVRPIERKELEEFARDLPKYVTNDSIRDRWE